MDLITLERQFTWIQSMHYDYECYPNQGVILGGYLEEPEDEDEYHEIPKKKPLNWEQELKKRKEGENMGTDTEGKSELDLQSLGYPDGTKVKGDTMNALDPLDTIISSDLPKQCVCGEYEEEYEGPVEYDERIQENVRYMYRRCPKGCYDTKDSWFTPRYFRIIKEDEK